MSTSSDHPTQPTVSAPTPEQPDAPSGLRAEIEALRRRVRQLEEEQARDRQTLAALEAERDAYRRAAYAYALAEITDEDIQRYGQLEDGEPLEAFIGELEQIMHRDKGA